MAYARFVPLAIRAKRCVFNGCLFRRRRRDVDWQSADAGFPAPADPAAVKDVTKSALEA